MNKKVILVDVDDTVVPSVREWIKFYTDLTGHELTHDLQTDGKTNDILDLMHKHHDPMEFWRQPKLYHGLTPRTGSVEVLKELSEHFDIVFVSASMPEHTRSKEMFLTKHFGFHKGFVSTRQKKFVRGDYFIDDYKKYLRDVQEYQPNCKCIQIKTKLSNKGEFPLLDWWEIRDLIREDIRNETK